ncbi:MAG: hypothetical protein M1483_07245 [Actinobacteria bacterium]|nr:hypothetical protein [Actinomycetota bacterium]MCL6105405.1 hypothetical protein [Actinomycetota bacterium]
MTQNNWLKRYRDAGITFTELNRSKAKELVKELVKTGEVQRSQAQEWVDDLLERSRKSTEVVVGLARQEVTRQLNALGINSREDIINLVTKVSRATIRRVLQQDSDVVTTKPAAGKPAAGKPTAGKPTTAKPAAKKPAAKKPAAKKPAAKKPAAKKAPVTKASSATKKANPTKASPARKRS